MPTSSRQRRVKQDPAPIITPTAHFYNFPVIRGIQAGREFYTSMVPIRLLSKLFIFDSEEVPPELRAQRILNESRARKIGDYMVENPTTYVFNSITVMIDVPSLDGLQFIPESEGSERGQLKASMDGKFIINDGQHRVRGAIEAYKINPEFGDETLPIVFFLYVSLERAQQVFHDLNKFGSKPNSTINLLYNHNDPKADVTRSIVQGVEVFKRFTDMERTSITAKSSKLFTMNGIDEANRALFFGTFLPFEEQVRLGVQFWNHIFEFMGDWQNVFEKKVAPFDVRSNSLSGHAVTLVAIGTFGNKYIANLQRVWTRESAFPLEAVGAVNWDRTNPDWQELVIFNGKIDKSKKTCAAIAGYIAGRIEHISHPAPPAPVDIESEKYQEIKEFLRTRLTEISVGVSLRSEDSNMPYEYHALLELEKEGHCERFIDNGWQFTWRIIKKQKARSR